MKKVYLNVKFDVVMIVDDDADIDDVISDLQLVNGNEKATMDDYSIYTYNIEDCK